MPRLIASALLGSLATIVIISGPAHADEPADDERIAKRARETVEHTREALKLLKELEAEKLRALEVVRKARVRPGKTVVRFAPGDRQRRVPIQVIYGTREEKEQYVQEWEEEVEKIRRNIARAGNGFFFYGYMPENLGVGDFGRLTGPSESIEVLQVIGPNKMLVVRGPDIIDGQTLLIEGASTAGAADGQKYQISTPLEVTGTASYTTVLGVRKTVLKLEPLDIDAIKAYIAKHKLWRD